MQLTSRPGTLLEGMEHVDRFRELGHVEHPVFPLGVDPDLRHARPDRGHGPPIVGRQALLNPPELVAGVASGSLGECAEVSEGAPSPSERLVGQRQYISNCMGRTVTDQDLPAMMVSSRRLAALRVTLSEAKGA